MKRVPAGVTGSPPAKPKLGAPKIGVSLPAAALVMRQPANAAASLPLAGSGPRTVAIDVGGTRLKAGLLDHDGVMIAGPARVNTPKPAHPAAVLADLRGIVVGLGAFDRVSVGFPGVSRGGTILTAPNLGNVAWKDFPLAAELTKLFGKPVRLTNDAIVQGLGVISGVGVELVLTMGTGMGYALFQDGLMSPHVEMGQHIARGKRSYDHYVGNAAYLEVGGKKWNRRVARVIAAMRVLTNFNTLLIGGGNAKNIAFKLPSDVRLVSNQAGITGGVRLWDTKLDPMFGAND